MTKEGAKRSKKYYYKNRVEILEKQKKYQKTKRVENPLEIREKDKKKHLIRKKEEKEYQKQYSKTHKSDPFKLKARVIVNNAIKLGKLKRPELCERCTNKKPQAHHPNYEFPLQVLWLCSKCHALEHHPIKALSDIQVIIKNRMENI